MLSREEVLEEALDEALEDAERLRAEVAARDANLKLAEQRLREISDQNRCLRAEVGAAWSRLRHFHLLDLEHEEGK